MKQKIILILFFFIFITTISAQENNTNFLNDYKKWSVFWQYTVNKAGTINKQDNSVQFTAPLYVSKRFGVLYNIYQTDKFNFKTGIFFERKMEENNMVFTKEQTGWLNDFVKPIILYEQENDMWSIPLMVEYIHSVSKTVKWVLGGDFTFSYYKNFNGVIEFPFEYDTTKSIIITYDDLSNKPIHTSISLSTGFYFLLKPLLLQAQLRYSKNFRTLRSGSYLTKNFIDASNNTTGTYRQSGDYFGFSLTVNFRKNKKIQQ